MQVHLNGFFNAGFLFCANKTFAKHWRRIYLTDSRFYEQQGMDYISEKYSIDFFDREYNVGWWQHEERWFENTELKNFFGWVEGEMFSYTFRSRLSIWR